MSKICLFFLLLISSFSLCAQELTSFESITHELKQGKGISAVIDDNLCEMHDSNAFKIPPSTMVIRPETVLFKEDLIAFDGVKFAHGSRPPLPTAGLLQRGSVILDTEGKMTLVIAFYDAASNQKIPGFDNVTINCQLGEGMKVFQA